MLKRFCLFFFLFALVRPIGFIRAQDQLPMIPAGTEIQLTLRDAVSSKLSEPGDEVLATVRRDVFIEGRKVIPEGAELIGRVTIAEAAKRMSKGGQLHLTFERIRLNGQEKKLTAVIRSASDFARDEKIKTDNEGTLKGGKDGGKMLQNVMTAAGVAGIGVTIAILAGIGANDNGGFGGYGGYGGFGNITRGGAIAGASVLGGGVIAGVVMTKGKEVRLDQHTIIRLKLERPLTIE